MTLGALAVTGAVLADLGRAPFVAGALLLALGAGMVLHQLVGRRRRTFVAACAVAALVVAGGTVWGLRGAPGSPPHWEATTRADLSVDSFRQGSTLFLGGSARDVSTGEVRWSAPEGSHLMTTTDDAVILDEPVEGESGRRLVARLLDSGRQVWWTDTGARPRAVARDRGVLAVTSRAGTTGHDLTTGDELWYRPERSGSECASGTARAPRSTRLDQSVVLIPATSPGSPGVALVSVFDGKVVADDLDCLGHGRVVDDVYVESDSGTLTGRSASSGAQQWEADNLGGGTSSVLSSAGRSIVVTGRPTRAGTEVVDSYLTVDPATGEATPTSPPTGWVPGAQALRDQRSDVLWHPVARGTAHGLWSIGSGRVVGIPSATGISITDTDPSGWVAVVGAIENSVGERERATWAISPDGVPHGPFAGGSAAPEGASTVSDAVVRVGPRVFPLD